MAEKLERSHIIFIAPKSCPGFPHTLEGLSADDAGAGRSPGERKGYPLQFSWASLVAQLIKNPPAIQETWVQSLGWEDPLEKGKLPTSVFWPENSMDYIVHGVAKSWTLLRANKAVTY